MSKYYCPKCGNKKLERASDYINGTWRGVWKCKHNAPITDYHLREMFYGRHGHYPKPKGDPCGLVISHPDRDAKIDDYRSDLEKVAHALDHPMIETWILNNNRSIRKRGLKVLYQGELFDIVRRTDDNGAAVALYWRHATYDKSTPDIVNYVKAWYEISGNDRYGRGHPSVAYFHVGGVALSHVCTSEEVILWRKDGHSPTFGTEKGFGKKAIKKMTEWAAVFERDIDGVLEQARSYKDAYVARELAIKTYLGESRMSMSSYSDSQQTIHVGLPQLTARQILDLNEVLPEDKRINDVGLLNGEYITPQEALAVVKLLNREETLISVRIRGEVSVDLAKRVADLLRPENSDGSGVAA